MDLEIVSSSIGIGIVSGYIASYFFLMVFLKRKKPSIGISKHISKVCLGEETNYFFKLVNTTGSEIFDVRVEAEFYKPFGDRVGKNVQATQITLIDGFKACITNEKSTDEHNLHAVRIRTTDKIEDSWIDGSSYISLTVIAKHSLSGLNKVFNHTYLSKDCITEKKFVSGNSLEVD